MIEITHNFDPAQFIWLWSKYVTGLNDRYHCTNCIRGRYYVHRSVVDLLPGVLRAYVGCATALFGDLAQADLVKIHKASGKVTFLVYDDFEGKPLPELQHRIKVNLKTRWVQAFDHRGSGQLLYFKERFLGPDHPGIEAMKLFSAKLRKFEITEQVGFGPTKSEFEALVARHASNENLKPKARMRTNPPMPVAQLAWRESRTILDDLQM